MKLIDLDRGTAFELRPLRYEFADVVGDVWDDNWLIISGRVTAADRTWMFEEPALTVHEGLTLAEWFEDVARGLHPPALEFVEPCLVFAAERSSDDIPLIRVMLSAEALLADDDESRALDFALTEADVERAASAWRRCHAEFPPRQ